MKINSVQLVLFVLALLLVLLPGCKTARFTAAVTRAPGSYSFEIPAAHVKDSTDADLTRVMFEGYDEDSKAGGGLSFEIINADDDLFVDDNNGIPMESDLSDFFGYGLIMVGEDDETFRMPFRYGLYYNNYNLEDTVGEIAWSTIGPRFSLEPTVSFPIAEDMEISIFVEGNAAAGYTTLDIDVMGSSGSESSYSYSLGAETGVKFAFHDFFAGLSYIYRLTNVAESTIDVNSTFLVRETEVGFTGVALTLGARF
jgi:hypothetical protein